MKEEPEEEDEGGKGTIGEWLGRGGRWRRRRKEEDERGKEQEKDVEEEGGGRGRKIKKE